jgi:hypothetical protein
MGALRRKQQWEGTAGTRHDATQVAADEAKKVLTPPFSLRVVDVYVQVTNPITEYKVIVTEV